jgi:uncharacterized membrane protein
MSETARLAVLLTAVITTGLTAGLFATFAYAVMPGLRRVDDATFVGTMRAINVAILNVWLLLILGGGVVTTGVAMAVHLAAPRGPAAGWLVGGLAASVATLLVTGRGNVPLNNRLMAGVDPSAAAGAGPSAGAGRGSPREDRAAFETAWIRWNLVRTGTSLLAFACLLIAVTQV